MNLYHFCKDFSQLPYAGGVLDQPARLMYVFDAIASATSEKLMRDEAKREAERRASNRS